MQVDDEDGQMAFSSGMGSDAVHQSLARLREDVPMNFNTVGSLLRPLHSACMPTFSLLLPKPTIRHARHPH